MIRESQTVVREIEDQDRTQLANLIHFGTFVHRHLDWRPPLGWIGHQPFNGLERNGKLVSALACPPDPPNIAWVRVFVCNSHFSQSEAWEMLWPKTKAELLQMDVKLLAAIPLQKWIRELLIGHGFVHTHNVISLAWDTTDLKSENHNLIKIREMTYDDLPQVLEVDARAFDPLWQNSFSLLELAFESTCQATVAFDQTGIIGYQISNPTQYGAHLGRLAVHPRAQRKGVGFALIRHLQNFCSRAQMGRISVNTQNTNLGSLSLYHKAGFIETEEAFPVFQYTF
jgi:ribosomal-protein-alanine N-acetyltransferase